MSKSFKNKLISGLLTLAMVFSMVPTNIFTAPIEVQAAEKSISDIPNVKMSFVQVDETTGGDLKAARLSAVQEDTLGSLNFKSNHLRIEGVGVADSLLSL